MNKLRKRDRRAAALAALAIAAACMVVALAGCGGDDNCAGPSENCSAQYIRDHGLTGCCEGSTCQDSAVTPGARVCR